MHNMRILFFCWLLVGLLPAAGAQVASYSPTFMVVPMAKTTESLIEVYENDATYQRMITALVQEGLIEAGATTVDFLSAYKGLDGQGLFRGVERSDIKSILLDNSLADVYVEIEVQPSENLTELIIKAYDAFTSELLSTKSCSSKQRLSNGTRSVFVDALSSGGGSTAPGVGPPTGGGWGSSGSGGMGVLKSFLVTTNEAFGKFVNQGQMINLEFNIGDNCAYTFFDMAKDAQSGEENDLAIVIEEWLMQPTVTKQPPRVNSTDNVVQARNIRVPVLKERNGTLRRYTPSLFATDVLKYCRTLKLVDDPDQKLKVERLTKGGSVVINFQ
jgi:hypothetical protein